MEYETKIYSESGEVRTATHIDTGETKDTRGKTVILGQVTFEVESLRDFDTFDEIEKIVLTRISDDKIDSLTVSPVRISKITRTPNDAGLYLNMTIDWQGKRVEKDTKIIERPFNVFDLIE